MGEPTLRIRFFGGLALSLGGAPLPPLESARAESLMAWLLLRRDAPQVRQHLAFLLWPDSTEPQALTNLRHVLHHLRRALPDPDRYLAVTPRTLQWRADDPCWLDVAVFEAATARAEREDGEGAVAALQEAVALYTGELLEGSSDESQPAVAIARTPGGDEPPVPPAGAQRPPGECEASALVVALLERFPGGHDTHDLRNDGRRESGCRRKGA